MTTPPVAPDLPELSFDYVGASRVSRGVLATMSEAEVRALAERYRRFLALKARYPRYAIAPTEMLDEMWHLHMLHPRAYQRDCLDAFGFILDHRPGFGATAEEEPALLRAFARTSALWEKEYREPYSLPGQPRQDVIICADEDEDEDEDEEEAEQPREHSPSFAIV